MLCSWLEDRNQKRMPVSQALIMDKALALWGAIKKDEGEEDHPQAGASSQTHRCEKFKASGGWFRR